MKTIHDNVGLKKTPNTANSTEGYNGGKLKRSISS